MPALELLLFTTDADYVRAASAAGVPVVVDWETAGKQKRQRGRDTQIGLDTFDDLVRVRAASTAPVIVRVHGPGPRTAEEVKRAIEGGADELLLPMVTTPAQVAAVIDQVAGRCDIGILIETQEAVAFAEELGRLPISRAYVGLNDLAIDRRSGSIFAPLVDGTLDRLRTRFTCSFGFGGLTLPDRGAPVPCRILIAEMARLRCGFSVLRRSFMRDVPPGQMAFAVDEIRAAYGSARKAPAQAANAELEQLANAAAPG
jgi:hypothetical protein